MQFVRPIRLVSTEDGHSRRASWLELFFDLIFVAAVAQVSVPLGLDYSIYGLARYALMFLLIWWAWLGHTMYASRFDSDDVVHRILTFVQIFAAAAMAANAKAAFDSRDSAGFGAAYAVLRTVQALQYVRARRLPVTRQLTTVYAAGFGLAALIWAAAAALPAPARFWLWGFALVIDLGTPWLAVRYAHKFPPHAEHLPERFGLFTIILLGESVAAAMRGMESQETWTISAATSALTGLALAFGYWWWYFDVARGAAERHVRSRRTAVAFHIWTYIHFPLYLSIAVVGVGVEHVISLPSGARLHREETLILVVAASILSLLLHVVGFTSEARKPNTWSAGRLLEFAMCGAALPAVWISSTLPPCAVLVWLAAVCAANLALVSWHRSVQFGWKRQMDAAACVPEGS